ncbi:MAG: 2-hydroxyacyl-CoA dehydratase [Oscillospiraceae bacterium]|nr:2-hydroxyacyl-CoA dehydratase [Oscillospiraceae bacterium]
MEHSLPKAFEEFGEARRSGFLKVKAVKDAGGLVAGTFCTFTPLEILDAAGFLPVSLCGMSDETIPAAERDLPKNLCPLIKSSYGFAVSDKCPYTYFADLIVGETTCDGKKKMYELLGEMKKVYILHLPQGQTREALDAWTGELRRFIAWLEETFSRPITEESLRRAVRERNRVRQVRRELLELQKARPPMAWGYPLYKALDGAGFLFSAEAVCEKISALTSDLSRAYARGERPVSGDARRILVTGCPIGGVLDKTVKPIEEHGGVVVCFENCTGLKAVLGGIDPDAPDIVRAIAERYLDIGCAVMTPDVRREELLRELVKEYKIDGVVEVCLQACTPYTVESFSVRRLMKQLGVPYLGLETDYSGLDLGQLSTRIEAFLEIL